MMESTFVVDVDYTKALDKAILEICAELRKAKEKFPVIFNSKHEAIAVIREEFMELEQEIFWGKKEALKNIENNYNEMHSPDSPFTDYGKRERFEKESENLYNSKIKEEAIQTAAMCLRLIVELT